MQTNPSLPEAMRYAAPTVRNILRLHPDDVDDVLQNAALRAHVARESFEGRSGYNSWFMRIAINQALMFLRSRQRLIESLDAPISEDENIELSATLCDDAPSPEERAIEAERARVLHEEIAKLSLRKREEMRLVLADVSTGTNAARKARRWHARRSLRVALERRGFVEAMV